jgi:hypothetical protein
VKVVLGETSAASVPVVSTADKNNVLAAVVIEPGTLNNKTLLKVSQVPSKEFNQKAHSARPVTPMLSVGAFIDKTGKNRTEFNRGITIYFSYEGEASLKRASGSSTPLNVSALALGIVSNGTWTPVPDAGITVTTSNLSTTVSGSSFVVVQTIQVTVPQAAINSGSSSSIPPNLAVLLIPPPGDSPDVRSSYTLAFRVLIMLCVVAHTRRFLFFFFLGHRNHCRRCCRLNSRCNFNSRSNSYRFFQDWTLSKSSTAVPWYSGESLSIFSKHHSYYCIDPRVNLCTYKCA